MLRRLDAGGARGRCAGSPGADRRAPGRAVRARTATAAAVVEQPAEVAARIAPGTLCVGDGARALPRAARGRRGARAAGRRRAPRAGLRTALAAPGRRARSGAALRPPPRRGAAGRVIEILPLQIDALDAIDAIERRAYPTPWSRAMFTRRADEAERTLLRRLRRRSPDRVPDRLALSGRLARDESRGRSGSLAQGHRAHAAGAALRGHRARPRARHHARGAGLERRRDPPLPLARLPAHGHPPRLLHGQPRGRPDHVAGSAERRARADDPRARDLLRRHLRRRRDAATARCARTSARPRPTCTRASAASCPRSRRGGTSSSSFRSSRPRSPRPDATLGDVDAVAVTQGPGLIGALLVGLSTAQGAGLRARAAARARSITCSATSRRCGSRRSRWSRRSRACWPRAGTRSCSTWRDYAAPVRLGGTRDDAAGEAFDKGARLLGLSEAGGAALERVARARRSRALPVPPRAARTGRARSLVLRASRPRCCAACASSATRCRARADLAASYQAAIVRQLVERAEAALDATGRSDRSRSSAAWRPTTRCAARWPDACARRGARLCLLPPALCVDNAAMIGAAAFAAPCAASQPSTSRSTPTRAARWRGRPRAGRAAPWGRVPSAGHDAPPPLAHAHARSLARGSARRASSRSPHWVRPIRCRGAALVGRRDRRRPRRRAAAATGDHRAGGAAGGRPIDSPDASKIATRDAAARPRRDRRAGIWMTIQYRFVNALNAVSATVRPDQLAQLRAAPEVAGRVSGAQALSGRDGRQAARLAGRRRRARSRPRGATASGVTRRAARRPGRQRRTRTCTISRPAGTPINGKPQTAAPDPAAAAHGTAMAGHRRGPRRARAGLHGVAPAATLRADPGDGAAARRPHGHDRDPARRASIARSTRTATATSPTTPT